MRKIESLEDEMCDLVTYELGDGQRISLSARVVRGYGIEAVLQGTPYADDLPTERVAVKQWGRVIGTVPGAFDPTLAKSKSFFYDFRRGDFVRDGDSWKAAHNMGPGDFEAVPGFVWEPGESPSPLRRAATERMPR